MAYVYVCHGPVLRSLSLLPGCLPRDPESGAVLVASPWLAVAEGQSGWCTWIELSRTAVPGSSALSPAGAVRAGRGLPAGGF